MAKQNFARNIEYVAVAGKRTVQSPETCNLTDVIFGWPA